MKIAMLCLIALTGCTTMPSNQSVVGRWGGQHVGLELGTAGGTLDYDCAAGTIEGPLLVDAAGRFTAKGTHTPGIGGPAQIGVTPRSHPANYSGSVRDDTMTLVVEVPAIPARIGPVSLRRGAEPVLLRCL
ncbi:MAG TPA: hypothetical protein VGR05_04875 [Sphingomicrobium sp.]|nr:hypothetical protein [Sphingomicrobium sp.]